MRISKLFGIAAKEILKHKVQTTLIVAAIAIGIAAITVIVAMTEGSNKLIMQRINNFGPDAIMIHSGGGKMRGPSTASEANLTKKDIQDISNLEGVKLISPFQVALDMPIKYLDKFNASWVWGVEPNWQEAWKRGASRGNFISETDNSQLLKVCVLGQTAAHELFGDADPIGEEVMIEKVSFKVIGLLDKRGQSPAGTDFDNLVIIPFTTASRRLMNQPLYIATARVIVADPMNVERTASLIREILRANHRLSVTEEDDFRLSTPAEMAKTIKNTFQTLNIFLWIVGILSPLVGGIVLMNIMLMTVSERRKEIGLRRAVGAKKMHITFQFITESLLLTFTGGLFGVIVGVTVVLFLSHSGKPVSVTWPIFATAFVFSALIGLFFGVYPARKASELDPASILSGK